MYSRVAAMSHRSDEKSAQGEYYKPEDAHGRAEPGGRKDLLAQGAVLKSCPDDDQTSTSNKSKVLRIPPRRLALCGGGIRGVAHVGVLKTLQRHGLLGCVKEMIGISAGSLFSLLWVLGYSLADIERLSLDFDFTILRTIEPESIFNFPFTYGLDNGENLEKLIHSILRQKGFGPDTTFSELARARPVGLRCFATELQTSKVREFSAAATPGAKVCMALRASMSLPFLYTPVKDPDSEVLLVDGGLLNNMPMIFLNEGELAETWGVFFIKGAIPVAKPLDDVMKLIQYVYDSGTFMRSKIFVEMHKERIICIPTDEYNTFNFGETREARMRLIGSAEEKTEEFLFTGIRSVRRFSAA